MIKIWLKFIPKIDEIYGCPIFKWVAETWGLVQYKDAILPV